MHRLTEIFSPMSSDEHQTAISGPVQALILITRQNGSLQSINSRIARYENILLRLSLIKKVLPRFGSWGEIVFCNQINCLSVELLGPRGIEAMSSQASLNMPHGNM